MSYPAQNTDTEFRALVEEVKILRECVNTVYNRLSCISPVHNYAVKIYVESSHRLESVFGCRTYKELFG